MMHLKELFSTKATGSVPQEKISKSTDASRMEIWLGAFQLFVDQSLALNRQFVLI